MARSSGSDFLLGAAVGIVIGAAAGILLAPASGKETRKVIGEKTKEVACKAKEAAGRMKGKLTSKVDKLQENLDNRVEESFSSEDI